jgi:hypothetical protein
VAESFDGTKWTITITQKSLGAVDSQILAVSCASTTSCMATGGVNEDTGTALAESWDGTSWKIVPTPTPDGSNGTLWGVSCPSTTLCVAVGNYDGGPLAAVWNGSSWTLASAAYPSGADSAVLMGVSCPTTTTCFAAGWKVAGGATHGLVEKWNGSTWSVLNTPDPGGTLASSLYSISCASTTSCIAVGDGPSPSFDYNGYAEKYDGTNWTVTSAPGGTGLMGVSCASSSYCVAVGYQSGPFASTWNGSAWTESTPGVGGAGSFQSVSCTSTTACVAVGNTDVNGKQVTTAQEWDGTSWTVDISRNAREAESTELDDVSCAANLCYAVGSANAATNVPFAEWIS